MGKNGGQDFLRPLENRYEANGVLDVTNDI